MFKKSATKAVWHILDAARMSDMHRDDASHPERGFGRMLPKPTVEPTTFNMLFRQF